MKFTEHEMVFFNSITKGNDVFGIPLKFRTQKSHEVENAVSQSDNSGGCQVDRR